MMMALLLIRAESALATSGEVANNVDSFWLPASWT